jgi:hypothetical protein
VLYYLPGEARFFGYLAGRCCFGSFAAPHVPLRQAPALPPLCRNHHYFDVAIA